MTLPAILPILPALGGLVWGLALAGGVLLSLLHPRGWRMWGAFLRSQWRGLAVLSVIGLTVVLARTAWRRTAEPPTLPTVELGLSDWPMFQGSVARLGSDDSPGPDRGGVNWTARGEYEFFGAPAVSGGHVVAVGVSGSQSRCFVWEIATGREVWSGAPVDYGMTGSSPVLAGGRIYVGEGVHDTREARVICLDPAHSSQHGIWELSTRSHVECTPVVVGDRLYVAAGDDGVYCLSTDPDQDVRTKATPPPTARPKVHWHIPGTQLPDVETALLVHAGRVYVGLGLEHQGLVVLDAESGDELRRVALPMPMFAPPALFAGGLLCGLGPGNLISAPTAGPGTALLVDWETLETRWSLPLSASMVQSAAVTEDLACLVSADGQVMTVDPQGRVASTWRSPSPIQSAPALSGGLVYVVSADGRLSALSLDTLTPVWQVQLGAPGLYLGSPVVGRGCVLVGTPRGFLSVGRSP